MSAYYETPEPLLADAELLAEALQELGFTPEMHLSNPVELPARYGEEKGQLAHVVIPREQTKGYNAVGFRRGPDGKFSAVVSDVDSGAYSGNPGSGRFGSAWLKSLRNAYMEKGVQRQAKRAGFKVAGRTVQADGKIAYKFIPARG
jgi:hypothetical protein